VFEFDAPGDTDEIDIQASLTYQLEAQIITTETESVNVELARVSNKTILNNTAALQPTPKAPAIGLIGSLITIVAAILVIGRKKSQR
jgi:hypothetical protein